MKKSLFSLCLIVSSSMPILSVIACNNDSKLDKANAKIQAISIKTVVAPTQKSKVQYGMQPISSNLNLPSKQGFSFSFKEASVVNDKGEAKVTYAVDVMPAVRGTTPKELTFIVGGFETKAEADVRNVNNANVRIQAVTTTTVVAPTKKNRFQYGVKPTSSDINPPSQTGFSFSFKEASAVNDKGEANVTYTVDVVPTIRGTTPSDLIFTMRGFETKAEADVRNVNNANVRIQAVTTTTVVASTKKNKVQYGVKPAHNDLNPPSQTGFSFRFKEASAVNDKGEADVTYIVDVMPIVTGTTPKELTFTIGGFETKAEADVRDNIVKANAKIQAVTTTTVAVPTMDSKVHHGVKPTFGDINPPSQTGFSFKFKEASVINDKGESKVTYTVDVMPIVTGTTPSDLIFTIGGFETKAEADVRVRDNINKANAKIQAVTTTTVAVPTMDSKVHHGVKPTFGDINPPSQTGFSFSFKEASVINDKGESKVTYTVDVMPIVTGTTPSDLIFTIGGFETKAEADVRDNIDRANAKIQALKNEDIRNPTKKEVVQDGVRPISSDLVPPVHVGFSFSFKSATAVSSSSKDSMVTYTIDVVPIVTGTTTRDVSFIVMDFY